jgi:hypothetical protein
LVFAFEEQVNLQPVSQECADNNSIAIMQASAHMLCIKMLSVIGAMNLSIKITVDHGRAVDDVALLACAQHASLLSRL